MPLISTNSYDKDANPIHFSPSTYTFPPSLKSNHISPLYTTPIPLAISTPKTSALIHDSYLSYMRSKTPYTLFIFPTSTTLKTPSISIHQHFCPKLINSFIFNQMQTIDNLLTDTLNMSINSFL